MECRSERAEARVCETLAISARDLWLIRAAVVALVVRARIPAMAPANASRSTALPTRMLKRSELVTKQRRSCPLPVFDRAAASQLWVLERRQALGEATLFLGAFDSELSALQKQIINVAWWDDAYEYMEGMDPEGPAWALYFSGQGFLTSVGVQAVFAVLPNGTLLNGIMWDANESTEVAVSPSLSAQVGTRLVTEGKVTGLFWIPETRSDTYGDDVGWLVYARNAQDPLASIAEVADLCVAIVTDTEACSTMRSVWDVEPVRMQHQMTEGSVGVAVAPASAFDGLGLHCSSTANQSHETYLAIGAVLTTRYMILIVCLGLCLLFALVVLLLEIFVIRILTSISAKIVGITACAVRQTEGIMRNIFPHVVLARIKRDESNNQTYPVTSVLFADICNFTLWSSALSPDVVTKYLNGVYSRMDEIVEHEGATKIKTIGDAYVVACGLSPGDSDCTRVCAMVAVRFSL
eukprot:m51a1_g6565 putative adenylate guanylate cyclase (465) ;mRNA; r:148071-150962